MRDVKYKESDEMQLTITIEGTEHEITDLNTDGYELPYAELDDGTEWYLAEDRETAGEKAREHWKEMAENDPEEFTCMVGEKTLVAWALGNFAGPGTTQVKSLEGWLDLSLDAPEEHFNRYDGLEYEITEVSADVEEELGFKPTAAYRSN